jgi:hypothetical protein
MFDIGGMGALAWAEQEAARQPGEEGLPVLPPLRGLFGDGGLRRGSVVAVHDRGYLPLALAAGVSAAGGWCAAVGLPDAGVVAAAGLGMALDRLLLVDEPGERWPEVTAALLDGVELVLLRPAGRPGPTAVRRLTALARRQGAALVVVGDWAGATLRLRVSSPRWLGLGDGYGHLQGRLVQVVAEGRGGAVRPRVARLWLPGPDGGVASADVWPEGLTPGTPTGPVAVPAPEQPVLEVPELEVPELAETVA